MTIKNLYNVDTEFDDNIRLSEYLKNEISKNELPYDCVKKYLRLASLSDDVSRAQILQIKEFCDIRGYALDFTNPKALIQSMIRYYMSQDGYLSLFSARYGINPINPEDFKTFMNYEFIEIFRFVTRYLTINPMKIYEAMDKTFVAHNIDFSALDKYKLFKDVTGVLKKKCLYIGSFVLPKATGVYDADASMLCVIAEDDNDGSITVYIGSSEESQSLVMDRDVFAYTLLMISAMMVRQPANSSTLADNALVAASCGISLTSDNKQLSPSDLMDMYQKDDKKVAEFNSIECTQILVETIGFSIFSRASAPDSEALFARNNTAVFELPFNIFGDGFLDITHQARFMNSKNIGGIVQFMINAAFGLSLLIPVMRPVGGLLGKVVTANKTAKVVKIGGRILSWLQPAASKLKVVGGRIVGSLNIFAVRTVKAVPKVTNKLSRVLNPIKQSKFTNWLLKRALPTIGLTAAGAMLDDAFKLFSNQTVADENPSVVTKSNDQVGEFERWKFDKYDLHDVALELLEELGYMLSNQDIAEALEDAND